MERPPFCNPLLSRKLWAALLTAGLVLLNKKLGWDLPEDTISIVATIAITYILGQSYVDGRQSRSAKKRKDGFTMNFNKLLKFLPQLLHIFGVMATADKNGDGILQGEETTAAIVRILPDVQAMLPKGAKLSGKLATYDGQVEFSERMVELIEEYSK